MHMILKIIGIAIATAIGTILTGLLTTLAIIYLNAGRMVEAGIIGGYALAMLITTFLISLVLVIFIMAWLEENKQRRKTKEDFPNYKMIEA